MRSELSDRGAAGVQAKSVVRVVVALTALAVVAMVYMTYSEPFSRPEPALVTSIVATLFGIWVFWDHGGARISAAGIYCLASAAFVGYAGIWWINRLGQQIPSELSLSIFLSHVIVCLTYILFWTKSDSNYSGGIWLSSSSDLSRRVTMVGALLMGAGWITVLRSESAYAREFVFVGVVFLAAGLISGGTQLFPGFLRLGLVLLAIGSYVFFLFGGYGRLVVVSLMSAPAIMLSARLGSRLVKFFMLVGSPLAIECLTRIRSDRIAEYYGSGTGRGPAAPDSNVSPLETFARLIDEYGQFTPGNGSTFLDAAVVFVPRSIWSNKPIGFGAELTGILEPEMSSSGHSMAALAYGEWFFNFGWMGLGLGIFVVGFLIKRLDLWVPAAFASVSSSKSGIRNVLVATIAISGLTDYFWVGTFTYAARVGLRLAIVICVAEFLLKGDSLDRRESSVIPPKQRTPREGV